MMACLNAHETPPQDLKDLFKRYQKLKPDQYFQDENLIGFAPLEHFDNEAFDVLSPIATSQLQKAFDSFLDGEIGDFATAECRVYGSRALPGRLCLVTCRHCMVAQIHVLQVLFQSLFLTLS